MADSTVDLEAIAKAMQPDPAFDQAKVIGTWAIDSVTLSLASDGTCMLKKEKDLLRGTWIGAKNGVIVIRFKGSDSVEHFTLLKLSGNKLIDDQIDYKVTYSRK